MAVGDDAVFAPTAAGVPNAPPRPFAKGLPPPAAADDVAAPLDPPPSPKLPNPEDTDAAPLAVDPNGDAGFDPAPEMDG